MIDVSLVDEPVSSDNFSGQIPLLPSIFLGFILKNEYDNKRLHINDKFNPKKFFRIYKEDGKIKGWKDFYKNRTPYDFKMVPHWDRLFGGYWVINEGIGDLYYRGFKKDI